MIRKRYKTGFLCCLARRLFEMIMFAELVNFCTVRGAYIAQLT